MKRKHKSIFGLGTIAFALAVTAPNATVAKEADDFQRFTALPILGYSEETALEYGGMMLLFFKPDFQGGETSAIDFAAIGTTRKQFEFLVTPRYYMFHDRVRGTMKITVDNWTSSFFGIGNDPDLDDGWKYDRKTVSINNTTQTNFGLPRALKNFMYGLSIHAEYSDINFEDYESLNFFRKVLRKAGVIDELEERGIVDAPLRTAEERPFKGVHEHIVSLMILGSPEFC